MNDNTDSRPLMYVRDADGLNALCELLAGSEWIAVDTEFLREKTYYPKLCLLQLANERVIACVDPLALNDLSVLFEVLFNPDIIKVLHSARQDYEIFYHLFGRLPGPVFDTQIAAAICTGDEQISYAVLVEQIVGVALEKDCTRTDWTRRPLTSQQLKYAQDDVRYLGAVYLSQCEEMRRRGVLNWHREECLALLEPSTYQVAPEKMWLRIKEHRRMKPAQLPVLQVLAAWREEVAVTSDRPRRWVFRDELLVELARKQPESEQQLQTIKGLPEKFIARHGQKVLSLIAQAKGLPREAWPTAPKRVKPDVEDEAKEDVMMALIRKQALDSGVAPSILGGRKDLEAMLSGDVQCRLLQGWRYEVVGKTLQEFLHGEITVTIEAEHLKVTPVEKK